VACGGRRWARLARGREAVERGVGWGRRGGARGERGRARAARRCGRVSGTLSSADQVRRTNLRWLTTRPGAGSSSSDEDGAEVERSRRCAAPVRAGRVRVERALERVQQVAGCVEREEERRAARKLVVAPSLTSRPLTPPLRPHQPRTAMSTSTRQLSIKAGVVTRSVPSTPPSPLLLSVPQPRRSIANLTHRWHARRLAKDVKGYRAEAEAQRAKVAQMEADSADEYELRAQVRSPSPSLGPLSKLTLPPARAPSLRHARSAASWPRATAWSPTPSSASRKPSPTSRTSSCVPLPSVDTLSESC